MNEPGPNGQCRGRQELRAPGVDPERGALVRFGLVNLCIRRGIEDDVGPQALDGALHLHIVADVQVLVCETPETDRFWRQPPQRLAKLPGGPDQHHVHG